MFTAATFQLIRKNSPAEFEALLNRLGIETDWSGDEFRIYDRLDAELTEKLCALMKSPTIIDGYMNLLDLGGVTYKYGEYDEFLGKVIANKDKILDAVRNRVEEYDLWQEKWSGVSPAPKKIDVLTIEADTARLFDNSKSISRLQEAWEGIKKFFKNTTSPDYHIAYEDINGYVKNTKKVTMLELDGNSVSIGAEDVADFIKRKTEPLHDGETQILCLKIKKRVEYRNQEIPSEPPKPEFTVYEAEEALEILAQLNEILHGDARE